MRNISEHAYEKIDHSNIISIAQDAKVAKQKNPKVINATIGMLFGEDANFYIFNSVTEADKQIGALEKFPYTNSKGVESFLRGVESWVFQDHYDELKQTMHIASIATPGGSGAISNTFSNYLNKGENVLLPSYMWSNYKQVAYENYLGYETYELFNEEGTFNLEDVKRMFIKQKASQGRILMVVNDPCHNPTGYSMSKDEWDNLIALINEVTVDGTPFTLMYDMAYIDYDVLGIKNSRENIYNFRKFNDSVITILCFSGSKTLGLYGLRIGSMICLTKNEEAKNDFLNACQFSVRTKYSMCSTYGMYLISKIFNDEKYSLMFKNELCNVRDLLTSRANIFMNKCKEVGLKTVPFKCGFFVTVPCKNDNLVFEELVKMDAFVVPLGNSLRITIASISLEECEVLPGLIKKAMDKVNGC